jgi:hypothetical protein
MKETAPDKLNDKQSLLQVAKKRMERCIAAENDNRIVALDDLRFASGDQWPETILNERNTADRPVLTMNQLPKFISQVVNDERQNRPAIKVRAVDDKTDPRMAEVYSGIIRNIEQQSRADIAYDTGMQNIATHGRGALRALTQYCDEESFDQEIRIGSVPNPFSVYFDLMMDPFNPENTCNYVFVVTKMALETFEEEYPGK